MIADSLMTKVTIASLDLKIKFSCKEFFHNLRYDLHNLLYSQQKTYEINFN